MRFCNSGAFKGTQGALKWTQFISASPIHMWTLAPSPAILMACLDDPGMLLEDWFTTCSTAQRAAELNAIRQSVQ
ncbi:MAG TPA: hypothetical protein VMM56_05970, partial [Planctomycetaceae bacterium]|nr:hypothetical protein [Planctomycetaceae bacterium]